MKRLLGTVLVLAFVLVGHKSLSSQVQGQWATAGTMQSARELHAQAPLPGGKVLSIGGVDNSNNPLSSSEIYSSGKWVLTGSMAEARSNFPAVAVAGKILVTGGLGTSSSVLAGTELYTPTTGAWSSMASLSVARFNHTATLLPNGKVLVTGGCTTSACSAYTAVSELYDPKSNSWSTTGSLNTARYSHTAVLLKTGKVLVVGGSTGSTLTSCEIYDSTKGTWTNVASTINPRYLNTTNLLSDGKVLAAGGGVTEGNELYPTNTAEVYDPYSNTWTSTGNMTIGRHSHTGTLLSDGTVLVAGGIGQPLSSGFFIPTPKVDVYNEAKGTFSATTSLSLALAYHAATLLSTGRALTDGGITTTTYCCVVVNNAQTYTPLTLTLSASSLNFGILKIGLTSATQAITVTNVSSHSVKFTSVTGTGDFPVTNGCPAALNAGQNCTITAAFEPTAVGTRKGVVTLKDNSPGNPTQAIALTGIGATHAITLLPGSLVFPSTIPGNSSAPLSITLYNDGSAVVNSIAVAISPADRTFTQTNNCPSTLNPNSSCVIQVYFTPPSSGTFTETLVVTDSDSSSPQTASLSGVGQD